MAGHELKVTGPRGSWLLRVEGRRFSFSRFDEEGAAKDVASAGWRSHVVTLSSVPSFARSLGRTIGRWLND